MPEDVTAVAGTVRKSDRTRQRILEAAHDAFARKGFSGVTIKDITEPAHVARANFYYYFQDKTALFVELGTATYLEVLAVVESFSDLSAPPSRTEIQKWVERYFEYLDRNGAFVIRSFEDAPTDKRFRAAVARSHRRTAEALGERIAKIAGTPVDANSQALGIAVMSMMERAWLLTQSGEVSTAPRAPIVAALAELVCRILR